MVSFDDESADPNESAASIAAKMQAEREQAAREGRRLAWEE